MITAASIGLYGVASFLSLVLGIEAERFHRDGHVNLRHRRIIVCGIPVAFLGAVALQVLA